VLRVKICGVTRPDDAVAAADAGADAIGLIFFEGSRRCVAPEQARSILAELPPYVTPVGLFVDESPERIRQICGPLGIRTVQLHGDEPPELVQELADLCVVKAFRVRGEADLEPLAAYPAHAYLLDSKVEGSRGGTGVSFDWALAAHARRHGRIIVAGGLRPENVAEAVRVARPYGVDASSGVESEPGKKDRAKMQAFVAAARGAEGEEIARHV
jgi:phosphoribosylanthranilate isomerase